MNPLLREVYYTRKSGVNNVIRVVDVFVEVTIIIGIPLVVGIIAVRRTTTNSKKSHKPYNRFLYV